MFSFLFFIFSFVYSFDLITLNDFVLHFIDVDKTVLNIFFLKNPMFQLWIEVVQANISSPKVLERLWDAEPYIPSR